MKKKIIITLCLLAFLNSFANKYDKDSIKKIDIPVMEIYTENKEEPSCDYIFAPEGEDGISITNTTKIPGRIILSRLGIPYYDSGEYENNKGGMKIKIRGNTSAYWNPKKSFKIKLEKKADLLNRNNKNYADKEWVLIDEGGDGMIAETAFKLSEEIGMLWTPQHCYINLFINDDYRGIYMLTESVKRNTSARLNVTETGYIIEKDAYWWNEDKYLTTNTNRKYTFKYPDSDDVTDSISNCIKLSVDNLEYSLISGNYEDYIDINSFAKWLLCHDILGDSDAAGSNIYITKYDNTNNTKIMMGNIWDLGGSFKIADNWSAIHTNPLFYYPQLIASSNQKFIDTYQELWNSEAIKAIDNTIEYLKEYSQSQEAINLQKLRPINCERWSFTSESIQYDIQVAVNWLNNRKKWLDNHINISNNINSIEYKKRNRYNIFSINGKKINYNTKGIIITNGIKYYQH
ncbi:CotH kinase family protein [Segatella baroniae]|uniref:CotH kinase family protein n=1 Tax=Segatella baroniae TaxID=305719 RepID=UPI0004102978|nr:CotH kinase family protein [Segatella baroniae]